MKEIQTLIWSEWRRQRKTFFVLLVSIILLWLLMVGMVYFKFFIRDIGVVAIILAIGLNVLYAVVLGDAFASEFTNKSNSFLLGMPISKTKIYFAKYISSLLPFLLISFIGTLLMYSCHIFLTDVVPTRGILYATMLLAGLGMFVHAAVFFCNLINRNSKNGVIMLVILPILLLILAPAAFVVNMFFFVNDISWIIVSIISIIAVLYFIFIMLGWYLWNTRISKDLRCLKPILKTIGIMFTSSALLYGLAYMYINYQYKSALQEAKKNNLILQDTSNSSAVELPKSLITFNKYRREHKISRMPLYIKLANRPYSIWKELQKKRKAEIKYLNNQDVQKLYSILENTSDKYNVDPNRDFFNTRVAIIFLIDMALIQARADKNKGFFNSLSLSAKYCVYLKQIEPVYHDSSAETLLRLIYYTIITIGPEGPAYADDYKEALNFIKNDKTYCPPYEFLPGLRHAMALSNPNSSWKSKSTNHFNSVYYHLRIRQGFASWIRYEIKRNKLYLEAEKTACLKEINNQQLSKESKNIFGYCKIRTYPGGLDSYFRDRCGMAGDMLCLALKFFRCRYGRYPEKLQELCPGILKEIPLDPINSKTYTYTKNKDGFTLLGGYLTMRGHSRTAVTIRSYKREHQSRKEKKNEYYVDIDLE